MTTFYLVRHGANDWLGKALAGRQPGVHLNQQGREQARLLGKALAREEIDEIISSPLARAVETAEPLARRMGKEIQISEEIQEIDFGDWSGAKMRDLEKSKDWDLFNLFRTGTRAPNGESMLEVQARFVKKMMQLRAEKPYRKIALFSHQDPIRCAITFWLGMPLDLHHRLLIDPGSYSVLRLLPDSAELLGFNITPN